VKVTLPKLIPGAHSDRDVNEDDEGQGAGILSFKSHVKLTPVELSNITSPGKLRSRHPTSKPTNINLTCNFYLDKNKACTYCPCLTEYNYGGIIQDCTLANLNVSQIRIQILSIENSF